MLNASDLDRLAEQIQHCNPNSGNVPTNNNKVRSQLEQQILKMKPVIELEPLNASPEHMQQSNHNTTAKDATASTQYALRKHRKSTDFFQITSVHKKRRPSVRTQKRTHSTAEMLKSDPAVNLLLRLPTVFGDSGKNVEITLDMGQLELSQLMCEAKVNELLQNCPSAQEVGMKSEQAPNVHQNPGNVPLANEQQQLLDYVLNLSSIEETNEVTDGQVSVLQTEPAVDNGDADWQVVCDTPMGSASTMSQGLVTSTTQHMGDIAEQQRLQFVQPEIDWNAVSQADVTTQTVGYSTNIDYTEQSQLQDFISYIDGDPSNDAGNNIITMVEVLTENANNGDAPIQWIQSVEPVIVACTEPTDVHEDGVVPPEKDMDIVKHEKRTENCREAHVSEYVLDLSMNSSRKSPKHENATSVDDQWQCQPIDLSRTTKKKECAHYNGDHTLRSFYKDFCEADVADESNITEPIQLIPNAMKKHKVKILSDIKLLPAQPCPADDIRPQFVNHTLSNPMMASSACNENAVMAGSENVAWNCVDVTAGTSQGNSCRYDSVNSFLYSTLDGSSCTSDSLKLSGIIDDLMQQPNGEYTDEAAAKDDSNSMEFTMEDKGILESQHKYEENGETLNSLDNLEFLNENNLTTRLLDDIENVDNNLETRDHTETSIRTQISSPLTSDMDNMDICHSPKIGNYCNNVTTIKTQTAQTTFETPCNTSAIYAESDVNLKQIEDDTISLSTSSLGAQDEECGLENSLMAETMGDDERDDASNENPIGEGHAIIPNEDVADKHCSDEITGSACTTQSYSSQSEEWSDGHVQSNSQPPKVSKTPTGDSELHMFGITCWSYLVDDCTAVCELSHSLRDSSELYVVLAGLSEDQLCSAYRFMYNHARLFRRYFTHFCDEFERRGNRLMLLMLISDCLRYVDSGQFIHHIFCCLVRCGLSRTNACRQVLSRCVDVKALTTIDVLVTIIISADWTMFGDWLVRFAEMPHYKYSLKNLNIMARTWQRRKQNHLAAIVFKCMLSVDSGDVEKIRNSKLLTHLVEVMNTSSSS